MNVSNRFTFACVALCTSLALPATAEVTDFGQGTQIGTVAGTPELGRDAKRVIRQFNRKARYFGAVAAHPDTQEVFWVYNFHSVSEARAAALKGCAEFAQAEGCQIYGVAMPESLPLDQSSAIGMGEEAADAFNTVYQEYREPGKYAAFAISGANHYGFGNAYDTAADAKDSALSYCQRGVARDMPEIGPRGREFARARGYDTCRVIDVQRSPDS